MIIVHSLIMLQALSVTKGFSVSGSDEPLVAALGEDIILPCNVDTPVPLEELELEWIKKDTSSLVHLSVAGEDQPESQHKSYRNRTQIFHENLLIGDYSLKLKKTEVQDEGKYRCVVHSRTQSEEVIVELKSVERLLVTGTNGPLFVYAGGEIVLNCFVNTHIPIEKLEVQWVKTEDGSETLVHLFVEGEDQPESQNQLYKGRTELSNESLGDGNFSLKLKSVGIKDKGIYKCKVHTNTESAVTTIELDVGPSVLHIFLYVFSIGSLLIGLGTVIQAGCYLFRKTQSKMGYYCFFVNIVIPHVLLAFAFVLWGILEADWAETVTCITTHLLRVLLLFLIVSDKLRELGMCQGICFQQLTKNVFVINIIIIEALMAASAISEMQRMKIQNLKDDLFFIICATLFALFNLCSIVILTFRILKVSFHRSFHFMRCVEQFSFKNIVLLHYVFLAMYANFISNRSDFFIGYIIATVVTLLCLATLLFHKNIQCPCKCLAGDCPKHADPWSDNETTTGDEEEPLSTAEWLRGGSCPEVSSPKTSAHRVEGALEDRKFLPKTSTALDGVCCVPAGEYKKAGPTNVNPGTPEDPTEHAQELHGSQPAGVRERLSSCAASLAGIIEPDECAQDAGGDYGRAPESRTGVVNAVRRGILQSVRCVGTVKMAKVLLIITLNILLVVWLKNGKGKPTEMVLVTFVFILLWVDLEVLANKSGEIYITLYLFGSTALIVVNSAALIIEVVILGNTGYRPVGDLVLIIVPFESLFLMCWNCLILYKKRQLSTQKQESDFVLSTTKLMKNARNDNLNSQNADEPLQRRHTHEKNEYSENNFV